MVEKFSIRWLGPALSFPGVKIMRLKWSQSGWVVAAHIPPSRSQFTAEFNLNTFWLNSAVKVRELNVLYAEDRISNNVNKKQMWFPPTLHLFNSCITAAPPSCVHMQCTSTKSTTGPRTRYWRTQVNACCVVVRHLFEPVVSDKHRAWV